MIIILLFSCILELEFALKNFALSFQICGFCHHICLKLIFVVQNEFSKGIDYPFPVNLKNLELFYLIKGRLNPPHV